MSLFDKLTCAVGLHLLRRIRHVNPVDVLPTDFESIKRWLGPEVLETYCDSCGKVLERENLD